MDSVGLYTFGAGGGYESGVILGMPDAFIKAYETAGVPIDPVLAQVKATGAPASTLMALGDRWTRCQLYLRVSGRFGLHGFAALPLYEGERMSGILYFGAMSEASAARLDPEGMCSLTVGATQVSTALMAAPRRAPGLSPRRNDVARLAAEGLGNRQIAEALGTGEAAVRKHLKALNEVFGTSNRTAMAAAWRRAQG